MGCFVQFIGTRWPVRVAHRLAAFGPPVRNMPLRPFLFMVLAEVRGLLSVDYPGAALLGHLALIPSPPAKGMPKEGFHV